MRSKVTVLLSMALSFVLLLSVTACGSGGPSPETLAQVKLALVSAPVNGSIGFHSKHHLGYVYRLSEYSYLVQDLSGSRSEESLYNSADDAIDAAAKKFGDAFTDYWAVPPLQESTPSGTSSGFDISEAARALDSASIGHGIIVHTPTGDFTYTRVYPDTDTGNKNFWAQSSSDDPGIFYDQALEALEALERGMTGVGLTGFTPF
jgi:hypothetical protein